MNIWYAMFESVCACGIGSLCDTNCKFAGKKTGKSKGTPRGFNSVTTKARATGAVGSSSNPDTNKDILHLSFHFTST